MKGVVILPLADTATDWTAFQKFCKCSQPLGEAIKKLNGATRGGKGM